MDDWEFLQAYAKDQSEAAFAKLVSLHIHWVYSVALRQVGDPQLAQDVVQSVFVLLARKGPHLRRGTLLGGWLFRTTCHVAAHARRTEQRRRSRDATCLAMSDHTDSPETGEDLWQQLAPHLDQAVAALSKVDRSAILLRFYEQMPFHQVGQRLGVSEEAAKKRVSRAVERMRQFLDQRGVKLAGVGLATVLANKTVQAASANLADAAVKISTAAGSAAPSAMLPVLARETLRAWQWTKIKVAAGLAVSSVALVFMLVSASGWLGARSGTQSVSGPATGDALAAIPTASGNAGPTATSVLNAPLKSGAIVGVVLDAQGRPVEGAKVWGGFGQQPFALDMTDSSGRFALDKAETPAFVTVTADGFAADQQEFAPTNVPIELAFHLRPVPPLKVRLVDESGQGVPGAALFLYGWWGRAGTLAQSLQDQTDADGRLQWLSAPKGEMELQFSKEGYRDSRTNKLSADNREHTIILHPRGIVTGRVTDAAAETPVANFKFTLGHSQPWDPSDTVPMWDMHSQTGSNGYYSAVITEEQTAYLRVEADGYDTVETEIQLTNGVEGIHDFQLHRKGVASSIRGTVFLPDGKPASGIEVALCTAQVGVMLKGTAFEPSAFGQAPFKNADYRRRTDEQGAFLFDPKPGMHTVVAVGQVGLGQTRCFDFSKPLVVQLKPWGRIEGTVRTRDGRWTDRKLNWQPHGNLTRWMTLFYNTAGFCTHSDASGAFTLEHIPPGLWRVAIDDGPGKAPILSAPVEVRPGQTAQVQVGGVGRSVSGKLLAPEDIEVRNWTTQVTSAELRSEWEFAPIPKELTGITAERWKLEFEVSEAGQSYSCSQYSYPLKVDSDGSFTSPEVLPGNYLLLVSVGQGSFGSGAELSTLDNTQPQIASRVMKFTVPDDSVHSGLSVELGDVVLTSTRH